MTTSKATCLATNGSAKPSGQFGTGMETSATGTGSCYKCEWVGRTFAPLGRTRFADLIGGITKARAVQLSQKRRTLLKRGNEPEARSTKTPGFSGVCGRAHAPDERPHPHAWAAVYVSLEFVVARRQVLLP